MPARPPVSARPSVSVVVPVRDGGAAFAQALDALVRLDPSPADVIVVEDGPQRDACTYPDGVVVLRMAEGRGPAAARNTGASRAAGDILFFVDADVVVGSDAIARIADAMADETIDAVFGSYDRCPPASGFISQFKNLVHRYVHQHAREEAGTFWSGCGAIRRRVFEAARGFDERFSEPSVEDIELGMRVSRAGGRIRLLKSLEVTHLKRWTLGSMVQTDIFRRAIPWSRLLLADARLPDDLNLRVTARVAAALTWALLVAVAVAPVVRHSLSVAGVLALVLVALDWPLWRYFASERGWLFAARAVPVQWLYYLYSSGAFLWVLVREGRSQPARVAADARASCE
jgi:GT2 family glycosyltransferase